MSEEIKSLKDYISTTKNKIFTTFKIETISNLIIYYEDLHQKVEQLENENEYLKMSNPEQNMEHFRIVNENKRKIDMLRKENHQLEKEVNKYQKELEKADSITQSCIFQGKQESKISFRKCLNRLEQLENIRKEAIEYIKNNKETREHYEPYGTPMGNSNYTTTHIFGYYELLDILNKGDNNGK